jgi:hypothetical protein
LGEFEVASLAGVLPTVVAKPIKATAPRWGEYIAARQAHYKAKSGAQVRLRDRHQGERQGVADRQRVQRADVTAGRWNGKGELLNALRSVVAAEQAAVKITMQERQAQDRAALRARYRPFPGYEEWLRGELSPEAADQWRYRDHEPDGIPARIVGDKRVKPRRQDIRDFVAEIQGDRVVYHLVGRIAPAFVDRGDCIDVHDASDEATILAALQLSAEKWGAFQVTGSEAYKARCVRLAARHGFTITNPELQGDLRNECEKLGAQRMQIFVPTAVQVEHPVGSSPLPIKRPRLR